MKITCLYEKLKEAFSITERIIGKNINLPILNTVLIEVTKERIQISSTDLELALVYFIHGKIEEEGKIAIPAKLIAGFINNLTYSKKVLLETKKQNLLLVKTEDYKAQILGINAEEFPIIPQVKKNNPIKLSTQNFIKSLEKTSKSVGISGIRPEITGVLFSYNSKTNELLLVSTDSFRLSEKKIIPVEHISTSFCFILPLKTVNEIIRIFSDKKEDLLFFTEDKNQILIEGENIQFISRLIEGEFPNYQDIIPKKFLFEIVISRTVLISKIRAISAFSSRTNDIVFTFQKNKIEISAKEPGAGEGSTVMSFKNQTIPEKISIMFNWKYILDGLESIDSDDVIFNFNSNSQPALLKPAVSNPDFLYIIMPIKNS